VWTLKFLDDVKALIELSEHIRDGTREKSVFGRLLELYVVNKHDNIYFTAFNYLSQKALPTDKSVGILIFLTVKNPQKVSYSLQNTH